MLPNLREALGQRAATGLHHRHHTTASGTTAAATRTTTASSAATTTTKAGHESARERGSKSELAVAHSRHMLTRLCGLAARAPTALHCVRVSWLAAARCRHIARGLATSTPSATEPLSSPRLAVPPLPGVDDARALSQVTAVLAQAAPDTELLAKLTMETTPSLELHPGALAGILGHCVTLLSSRDVSVEQLAAAGALGEYVGECLERWTAECVSTPSLAPLLTAAVQAFIRWDRITTAVRIAESCPPRLASPSLYDAIVTACVAGLPCGEPPHNVVLLPLGPAPTTRAAAMRVRDAHDLLTIACSHGVLLSPRALCAFGAVAWSASPSLCTATCTSVMALLAAVPSPHLAASARIAMLPYSLAACVRLGDYRHAFNHLSSLRDLLEQGVGVSVAAVDRLGLTCVVAACVSSPRPSPSLALSFLRLAVPHVPLGVRDHFLLAHVLKGLLVGSLTQEAEALLRLAGDSAPALLAYRASFPFSWPAPLPGRKVC